MWMRIEFPLYPCGLHASLSQFYHQLTRGFSPSALRDIKSVR